MDALRRRFEHRRPRPGRCGRSSLDGETLNFRLNEAFEAIASCSNNDSWGELWNEFRTEWYSEVVELLDDCRFKDLLAEQ